MISVKEFIEAYPVIDKKFINSEEREKYKQSLKKIDDLFDGNHLDVYGESLHPIIKKNYVTNNVVADLIRLKVDLMSKDTFELYAQKNKDLLLSFGKKNKIRSLLNSSYTDLLKYGNSYFYLDFSRKPEDPTQYDFKLRLASPKDVWYIASNSAYQYDYEFVFTSHSTFIKQEGQENPDEYMIINLHSKIDFITLAYKVDGDSFTLVTDTEIFDSNKTYYEHNLGEFLIFNFKNRETVDFISEGDFTPTAIDRQGRLNFYTTVREKGILDWANPFWVTNQEFIDFLSGSAVNMPDGTKELDKASGKILGSPVDKKDFYLEKIEPAGYMKELIEAEQKLEDSLINSMNIDASIYREMKENGQVQSGKALEVQKFKTINGIRSKHKTYEEGLSLLFNVLQKLMFNVNRETDAIDDIEVIFNFTLFNDEEQDLLNEKLKLEVEKMKLDMQLYKSRDTITKEVEGSTDEEIAEEKSLQQQEQTETNQTNVEQTNNNNNETKGDTTLWQRTKQTLKIK